MFSYLTIQPCLFESKEHGTVSHGVKQNYVFIPFDSHLPWQSPLWGQSRIICVFSILGTGTPFQIGHIIVVLVAVNMIDNRKIVRIRNECFGNQSVCHSVPVVTVFPQTHKFISIRITPTVQDLGGKVFSVCRDSFARSDSTVG